MAFILRWKNPTASGASAPSKADINVPVGAVISNRSTLTFTGKGAANYGTIQQENLMKVLENSADNVPPPFPTVGQTWYDTSETTLRVCIAVAGGVGTWRSLAGIQVTNVGEPAPTPAANGDMWFQRTGSTSGILHVYTGLGRFPLSATTIGGWHQLWPTVETVAGREEYEVIAGMVNQLIFLDAGGSGALGKVITNLTNFNALDTNRYNRWANTAPVDPNVLAPTDAAADEMYLVDPMSHDWDTLLAAAKYAVNRLDLPADMVYDISPVPFVSDGRQAPASLLALPGTVMYPSLERRSNRRFGIVTLVNAFSETVNVLTAAIQNRYNLKGINGNSGTNQSFDSTTVVASHATFSGAMSGADAANVILRFRFNTTAERSSFIQSGGSIQVTLTHGGGGGGPDQALRDLFNERGIIRLTADRTRVFANVLPLVMTRQPISVGLLSATGAGIVLTDQTGAGASYSIGASFPSPTLLDVQVSWSSFGAMTQNVSVNYSVIKSNETYAGSTPVYSAPFPYAGADKVGGSSFIN